MSESHGPPPDGLECLATMEDITMEDQNYGTLSILAVSMFHVFPLGTLRVLYR